MGHRPTGDLRLLAKAGLLAWVHNNGLRIPTDMAGVGVAQYACAGCRRDDLPGSWDGSTLNREESFQEGGRDTSTGSLTHDPDRPRVALQPRSEARARAPSLQGLSTSVLNQFCQRGLTRSPAVSIRSSASRASSLESNSAHVAASNMPSVPFTGNCIDDDFHGSLIRAARMRLLSASVSCSFSA